MNIIRKIMGRTLRFFLFKLRYPCYEAIARLQVWFYDGKLHLGKNIIMQVPVRVDGAGQVIIEEDVKLGYRKAAMLSNGRILLQARNPEAVISIKSKTATSNNISIVACRKIEIGPNCRIGEMVSIFDADFHEINPDTRGDSEGIVSEVLIKSNVWLGSRVIVLKGVTIGENSIIAAGSVVSKSIPANVIAGGVPAKVIRTIA